MSEILSAMMQVAPMDSPRGRFDAVVEHHELICREHYRLRLRVKPDRPFPATVPGQFIQLGCRPPMSPEGAPPDHLLGGEVAWRPSEGERPVLTQMELCQNMATLRKPFSLSGRGDDERGTWLEVIYRVVGKGTAWLAQLQVGDAVDFIGPLGTPFALPVGKSHGVMVGGGVGLPPMFYLAQSLQQAGWSAVGIVGALQADLLAVTVDQNIVPDSSGKPNVSVKEFADYGIASVITTDDGSLGLKGRVTDALDLQLAGMSPSQRQKTVVFTCGPNPMMRSVATLTAKYGVDCQVCLEQTMACGMGTCQSCVVKIEDTVHPQGTNALGQSWRYKLVCTHGPVFEASQVVWE